MQPHGTAGAPHGSTPRLYVWRLSRSQRKRRTGLDLWAAHSPVPPAHARLTVGRTLRGHGAPLAAGGQQHRWSPGFTVGCGVVGPWGDVEAGAAPHRTRDGNRRVGEDGNTG